MSRKFVFAFCLLAAILTATLAACQTTPPAITATENPFAAPLDTAPLSATSSPTSPPVPATPTHTTTPAVSATAQTATETPPATETATETSPTSSPSATPTPGGPLTWAQEARLYEASLKFLAEDEDAATIVVRDQIDYLESIAEHPSLVCGPLSAVILRDAGLLPPDTNLHGFWLLDPRTRSSQRVLENHFPKDRYEWYQFETSTTEFDFNTFPLRPGDFIYLYAGINGTFEHIITVTRVDAQGRAYTVSNLATEDGFVIRELMLYDPDNPGVGQFYDWMNREINGWLGMTGDGGFDLWRGVAPVQDYLPVE